MYHLFDRAIGCSMCGLGSSGRRELMRFGHVGMDIEGCDIASDEVEGRLGLLWNVDAQIERGL